MALIDAQNNIDDQITTLLPTFATGQTTERSNSPLGKFFQGNRTHATILVQNVNGTVETPGNNFDNVPAHANATGRKWTDAFSGFGSTALRATYVMDEYYGPQGPGYTLTALMKFQGTDYSRTVNVGPETFREKPWGEVVQTA